MDVFPGSLTLPPRAPETSKRDYGSLLIIAGSVGLSGAASLCAEAALRGGAGLVSVGVPSEIYPIVASCNREALCFPLPSERGLLSPDALEPIKQKLCHASAFVLGCGLGRSESLTALVRQLAGAASCPAVLDADALFALGRDPETILALPRPPILTPHDGEFARLGGALSGDRVENALSFAKSRNCALVLKGHRVICAFPDGAAYQINAGNPGMAKGGSGDALAGLIGSLLCQLPERDAILAACLIHAQSGDKAARRLGEYSMLPRELIAAIPEVMKDMTPT
jgi:NAD(P)H-hydrate epimerase